MARLALSVWVTLTVLMLIACVDDRADTAWARFPKLPVPAGDSLAEAHLNPGKRLASDTGVAIAQGSICTNCGRTAKTRAVLVGTLALRVDAPGSRFRCGRTRSETPSVSGQSSTDHAVRTQAAALGVLHQPPIYGTQLP